LLPENFADRMLEIEHPRKDSIENLNELVGLYSSAIEYYESIHDDLHLIYQKNTQYPNEKGYLGTIEPKA
jgi:hypothetical protein